MKEHAATDGVNTYGFPLKFYTYCDHCDNGLNLFYLLTDIGFTVLIAYFGIGLKNKIFNH